MLYTVVALINENNESLKALGTFTSKVEAETFLVEAKQQRARLGKKYEYRFITVLESNLNN